MKLINLNETPWSGVSHNPAIRKQVILGPGELPAIRSLSRAVFRPGDKADAHTHADMAEVFMVAAGRGVVRLDGAEYPLTAETVVVAEPGERHEIANTGDDDLVVIYFGVAFQPPCRSAHPS